MHQSVHQQPEWKLEAVTSWILKNYSTRKEEIFIIGDIIRSVESVFQEFAEFKGSS